MNSLGLSLTDTLDDLINDGRIEPQLAMKILSTFDKVITEVLADKVRARLTFKVSTPCPVAIPSPRSHPGLTPPNMGDNITFRFFCFQND